MIKRPRIDWSRAPDIETARASDIATRLGCTVQAVYCRRKRLATMTREAQRASGDVLTESVVRKVHAGWRYGEAIGFVCALYGESEGGLRARLWKSGLRHKDIAPQGARGM